MRGAWLRRTMLPVLLAVGLGACASGVQPGIVYNSGVPQGGSYGNSPYGGGQNSGGYNSGGPYGGAQRVSGSSQQGAYPQQQGAYPQQASYPQSYPQQGNYPSQGNAAQAQTGGGRVVSINEVGIAGQGGGGNGNGAVVGGLLGAGAGATIGALTANSVGGGLVGALLGAVGGAIIGTIADGQHGGGSGRGIEVTVQRDDGQQVTVAQRDDGDIQLGDRVQIVQNRQGVAQVVRDAQQQRAPD